VTEGTPSRLLRLADVSELTSLGKSTINLWVAQGKFPAPTTLSPTIKVWRVRDVEEWIEKVFSGVEEDDSAKSAMPDSTLRARPVAERH
jgi:prophage regulatory protein